MTAIQDWSCESIVDVLLRLWTECKEHEAQQKELQNRAILEPHKVLELLAYVC